MKFGTVWPPYIIAAVPVGETKMTFEFDESGVPQGKLQNVVSEYTGVSAVHGPDDVFPFSSNRIIVGKVRLLSTMFTWPLPEKSTTLVSALDSIVPFRFRSVMTENDVGLVISTRD